MDEATEGAIPLSGVAAAHAVEVAPRLWWVGSVLPDDPFQCHAYLVEAGDRSVLVDPGSTLTIDDTLRKVQEVVPLGSIQTILLHHSDPDVCDALHRLDEVLLRPDVSVLTEWRSALLLRHLGVRFPFRTIEDEHWSLDLGEGRRLDFALTAYLHFPGAFVTFDRSTRSLLSSDLFGGFNRRGRLWATGPDDFEDLRQFHEHYMPSREVLIAGLGTIINRFGTLERVLPQHGYLIPEALVEPMFEQLSRLECGILLASRSDTHLARLLAVASVVRRVEDVLEGSAPLDQVLEQVEAEIAGIMPLEAVWVEVEAPEGLLRFDRDHPGGLDVEAHTVADERHHLLRIVGRDDTLAIAVVLATTEPFHLIAELGTMLHLVSARVHTIIDEALERRAALARELSLRTAATTDALTGLLNRRALEEWSAIPARAAVLMADVDHFKEINDRFGHEAGDRALRAVADAIAGALRRSDRAFRFGGEEFAVIVALDERDTDDDAVRLAERIRAAVEALDPVPLGLDHPITISIGLDRFDHSDSLSDHLALADKALYAAKALGRNRVVAHAA